MLRKRIENWSRMNHLELAIGKKLQPKKYLRGNQVWGERTVTHNQGMHFQYQEIIIKTRTSKHNKAKKYIAVMIISKS